MNRKLSIILFFFVAIGFNAIGQNTKYDEFVSKNAKVFEPIDSVSFSETSENYRMFAIGEYHYRKENSEIFIETFKNLYYNSNVRVIFMEAGFSHGLIVEHYLNTGSEASLLVISKSGQFDNNHYIALKKFYDILPEDEKFHIFGVDLDFYEASSNFEYTLDLLFQDTVMPENLETMVEDFNEVAEEDIIDEMQDSFNDIYFDWKHNQDTYNNLLGKNYQSYKNIMKRMKRSLRFEHYDYNYGQDSVKQLRRENYMYRNLVSYIEKHPGYNYFGQFGLAHVGLSRFLIVKEDMGFPSVFAKLNNNEDSPLKNQVCSLAIIYFDDFDTGFNKLFYYYSELSYAMSMRDYMPKKLYKSLKRSTKPDNLYTLNLAQSNSPLMEFSKKHFQFLIFKR